MVAIRCLSWSIPIVAGLDAVDLESLLDPKRGQLDRQLSMRVLSRHLWLVVSCPMIDLSG